MGGHIYKLDHSARLPSELPTDITVLDSSEGSNRGAARLLGKTGAIAGEENTEAKDGIDQQPANEVTILRAWQLHYLKK